MLMNLSRLRLVGWWCAAVTVIGAYAVVAGGDLTISNGELWLVACLIPPAVMLLVWQGARPMTVAELLHAVNEPSTTRRR